MLIFKLIFFKFETRSLFQLGKMKGNWGLPKAFAFDTPKLARELWGDCFGTGDRDCREIGRVPNRRRRRQFGARVIEGGIEEGIEGSRTLRVWRMRRRLVSAPIKDRLGWTRMMGAMVGTPRFARHANGNCYVLREIFERGWRGMERNLRKWERYRSMNTPKVPPNNIETGHVN